jgi:acyl-CoA hydrolase
MTEQKVETVGVANSGAKNSSALAEAFADFRRRLPATPRIYVAGCSGEPRALAEMLAERPDLAAGCTFFGIWIPGVNETDWSGLGEGTSAETIFLSPVHAKGFEAGRVAFRPLSYIGATRWLSRTPVDGVVVMVSAGRTEAGEHSFGLSSDFSGLMVDRPGVPVFALLNHHMPALDDAPSVAPARLTQAVEIDRPLIEVPAGRLTPQYGALGAEVAALIDDRDTLQFGLGTLQQATLDALGGHRGLRLHSGMVSDPLLPLLDNEAVSDEPGAVTTGVAIGTPQLYRRAATDPRFCFRPVTHTHAAATLAAIPRFVAINSAIEVDLLGQVNAEFIGERQVSGLGGLIDFLRGASLSDGGRGIIALPATAKGGTVSRIVPRLAAGAVSIARSDVDFVVTEFGAARLRDLDIEARAEALIGLAAPEHREDLLRAWHTMSKQMR